MKNLRKMASAAAAACATAVVASATAVNANPEPFPVVAWGAFTQEQACRERFLEAKDAGFTHVTQWCDTPEAARCALAEAEKAGVKLIVGLNGDGSRRGHERMAAEAGAFTSAVKDSPALEYYYVTDEPHIKLADSLGECVRRYAALDPAHPCYINLFGALCDRWTRNDAKRQEKYTGCATVGEYWRRFYDAVPLKMTSFDYYPVLSFRPLEDGDYRLHGERVFLKERWYETLEEACRLSRERKIPMMAFVLATAHRHYPANDYPVPTMEHMRLQLYSNLAYGAQAIQYYRFAQNMEFKGYNNAPVLVSGRRSPVFERVRELNKELQARAFVFKSAEVRGVWHTGLDVPLGTKRFKEEFLPPFVKSFSAADGAGAVVSWLRNGGKDYLVVVNRDPNRDMKFVATFVPGAGIVRRDGTTASAAAYADYFWLDPGDAAIFAATAKESK